MRGTKGRRRRGVVVAAYLITPVGGHRIIAGRVGFGNTDDNGNDEGNVEKCGLWPGVSDHNRVEEN